MNEKLINETLSRYKDKILSKTITSIEVKEVFDNFGMKENNSADRKEFVKRIAPKLNDDQLYYLTQKMLEAELNSVSSSDQLMRSLSPSLARLLFKEEMKRYGYAKQQVDEIIKGNPINGIKGLAQSVPNVFFQHLIELNIPLTKKNINTFLIQNLLQTLLEDSAPNTGSYLINAKLNLPEVLIVDNPKKHVKNVINRHVNFINISGLSENDKQKAIKEVEKFYNKITNINTIWTNEIEAIFQKQQEHALTQAFFEIKEFKKLMKGKDYEIWLKLKEFPHLKLASESIINRNDKINFDFLNDYEKFLNASQENKSKLYEEMFNNYIKYDDNGSFLEGKPNLNLTGNLNDYDAKNMEHHLQNVAEAVAKNIITNYFQGENYAQTKISEKMSALEINEDKGLKYALSTARKFLKHAKYDPSMGAPIEQVVAKLILDPSKASLIFERPPLGSRLSRNFRQELAQKPALIELMIEHGNSALLDSIKQQKLITTSHIKDELLREKLRVQLDQKIDLLNKPIIINNADIVLENKETVHQQQSKDPVYLNYIENPFKELISDYINATNSLKKLTLGPDDKSNIKLFIDSATSLLKTFTDLNPGLLTSEDKQNKIENIQNMITSTIEDLTKKLQNDYLEAARSLRHSRFDHNDRNKIKNFMESATSLLKTLIDLNTGLSTSEDKQDKIKGIQKMIKTIDILAKDNLQVIRKENDLMLKVKANVIQQPNAKDKLEAKKLLKAVHYVASNIVKSDEIAENHDKRLSSPNSYRK